MSYCNWMPEFPVWGSLQAVKYVTTGWKKVYHSYFVTTHIIFKYFRGLLSLWWFREDTQHWVKQFCLYHCYWYQFRCYQYLCVYIITCFICMVAKLNHRPLSTLTWSKLWFFTASSQISKRMLPFRALYQNDDKDQIICEAVDIQKSAVWWMPWLLTI